MNKYVALGIILVVVVGTVVLVQSFSPAVSLADAREIATSSSSECAQKGTVGENGTYNETSKTWKLDFSPKSEFVQTGCSPACVVDTVSKSAEINWACTSAQVPATYDDLLQVDTPLPSAQVTSPLTVTGKARGQWYFEASFPISLYDANNKLIAQVPAQAQGEWMTTEYVPFSATLTFSNDTATGTLVVQNDNPSGLPENQKEVRIPVTFANISSSSVKLYYYNPALDQGPGGVQCSSAGLVAVDRVIPRTSTPLRDSIRLLLEGQLTGDETAHGITTEFPLSGVSLTNATIQNGVATLTFADPQNKTGGGSCRVSVLWAQIEATAKQFSTVQSVRFMPEELFQP